MLNKMNMESDGSIEPGATEVELSANIVNFSQYTWNLNNENCAVDIEFFFVSLALIFCSYMMLSYMQIITILHMTFLFCYLFGDFLFDTDEDFETSDLSDETWNYSFCLWTLFSSGTVHEVETCWLAVEYN